MQEAVDDPFNYPIRIFHFTNSRKLDQTEIVSVTVFQHYQLFRPRHERTKLSKHQAISNNTISSDKSVLIRDRLLARLNFAVESFIEAPETVRNIGELLASSTLSLKGPIQALFLAIPSEIGDDWCGPTRDKTHICGR